MKLLLTSSGLSNDSIRAALAELTGKPLGETKIAFIPTAMHGILGGGPFLWEDMTAFSRLGWKSVALLELTAFPSLPKDIWLSALEDADVIYVDGGNTPYLSYWFQQSGFAAELPRLLRGRIYVGASAGSLMASHQLVINRTRLAETGVYADEQYNDVAPLGYGSDFTLGLIPVVLRPHLDAPYFEGVSMADMERACAGIDVPVYVIDDDTALKVVDTGIEVVSEGAWKLLNGDAAHV